MTVGGPTPPRPAAANKNTSGRWSKGGGGGGVPMGVPPRPLPLPLPRVPTCCPSSPRVVCTVAVRGTHGSRPAGSDNRVWVTVGGPTPPRPAAANKNTSGRWSKGGGGGGPRRGDPAQDLGKNIGQRWLRGPKTRRAHKRFGPNFGRLLAGHFGATCVRLGQTRVPPRCSTQPGADLLGGAHTS